VGTRIRVGTGTRWAAALLALAAVVPGVVFAAAGTAATHFRSMTVTLRGAAETPRGDPDGAGRVAVCLNQRKNEVSFAFAGLRRIGAPTAAHIHRGAPGTAGPVVVPFTAPSGGGSWHGKVKASKSTVAAIAAHPRGYYVNVHNDAFPNGAVRGQLRSWTNVEHSAIAAADPQVCMVGS
jgi:hypothetical protein